VVEDVLKKANVFFEQEACKPQVDTAPLKAEARKLSANIRKYQGFMEEEPDETLCRSHNARIKELQGRLNEVQAKNREADRQNRKPPKPLSLDRSKVYVPDLRELLNQEVPMAAEAIRTLCGPIKIRQEVIPGRPGARWIATFSPDLVAVLRRVAQKQGYTDASSLAAATAETQPVEVVIDKVPKYERLAPVFKQMRDNGASVQSIAHAHGMSWDYADQILKFADTGQRPTWGSGKAGGKGKAKPCLYKDIAPDVVRMRNVEKKPFEEIASILKVGIATVCRAYDFGCPDAVREAAEEGKKPRRGSSSRIGEEKVEEIRKMLREGKKDPEVAAKVGCGTSTVGRVRRKMKSEADEDQAA
jgi:transposase